jgi:hypothetical protein
MTAKPLYERAREAGQKAGEQAKKAAERHGRQLDPNSWESAFLCFMAKEQPGFEAAYRQFAAAYHPANKRWAEGNDD